MMKIAKYTDDCIEFDDGTTISYDHHRDCCEWNYADFSVLDNYPDELKLNYDRFEIEPVDKTRFNLLLHRTNVHGIPRKTAILIPCYSEQNGYYSCDLDVYVRDKHGDLREHHSLECELY